MPGRFDPGPLLDGLKEGLRLRRHTGNEEPDRVAQGVLVGVPGLVGIVVIGLRVVFEQADQLLAACALLSGALLTGFAQVASWRERLLTNYRRTDQVDIRALNEAAAHILVSLLVSVVAAVTMFVLANMPLDTPSCKITLLASMLSALGASALTYVALSLVIVVNLMWDALSKEQDDAHQDATEGPSGSL